ncbi:MAG: hypothetical protein HY364_00090 [Candidatus Aenigmarchaeota archaeon]|nr:hypothetical protein [Candidatus Aenigmarchaeota archaeon]
MKLPDIDKRMVHPILALAAITIILLIPLPQKELVAYTENAPYEAIIISENPPGSSTNKVCLTVLQPSSQKACTRDNISFSISTVECSNISASVATYNIHNLATKRGEFNIVVGFDLNDGKKSERSYDRTIDGKTTETIAFSISNPETKGCYIRVNNAVSELECKDAVKYTADTNCYGGDNLPKLEEERATLYKEIERQKFVTVYKPLIQTLLGYR